MSFYMVLNGQMGSYYYYKLYYVVWYIVLFLFGLAIDRLCDKHHLKSFIISYAICCIFVATIGLSGIETKIYQKNILFSPVLGASSLFSIYAYNISLYKDPEIVGTAIGWDFIELCRETVKLSSRYEGGAAVPKIIFDDNARLLWFMDMLRRPSEFSGGVPEEAPGIWVVEKKGETYNANKSYFDSLDHLYENNFGFIVSVQ
jgi:hypothetical protein